jgi:hypothetical protein
MAEGPIPLAAATDRFPFIQTLAKRPVPTLVVSIVPLDREFNARTLQDEEDRQHDSHWQVFVVDEAGVSRVNMRCGHARWGGVVDNCGQLQDVDPIYNGFDQGETVGEALAREVKATPEYVVLVEESNARHHPESWTTCAIMVASRGEAVHQQISTRAYGIWEEKGRPLENDSLADGLEAKKLLGISE